MTTDFLGNVRVALLIALATGHATAQTPAPPNAVELAYATKSPLQKLDLYVPQQGTGPFPLVVWIHGGGFRVGDKRSMPRRNFGPPPVAVGRDGPYQIQVPDVTALTAKGYAVASLNYRLGSPIRDAALPAVQDAKAAIRYLRGNASAYNLDERRIAVWGNSAGGIMAALLGATGDQPTLFDDPALGNPGVSSAVQAVVVWFGADDRLGKVFNAATYASTARRLPPFLIANGDADPIISTAQATRLHEALLKAGGASTLTILPGAGHEDPAFMATQMLPTFEFIDQALQHR